MKFYITTLLIFILFQISFSQNWPTIGGKNQRNGLSKIVGPDSISSPYWSVVSAQLKLEILYLLMENILLLRVLFLIHTLQKSSAEV